MKPRLTLLAAGLTFCAVALGAAGSPENGLDGQLEVPVQVVHRPAAAPRGLEPDGPWEIACLYFPAYTVKELRGNGKGTVFVSSTPATSAIRPPCGPQDDPGEKLLTRSLYLVGARGAFVFLQPPDGNQVQVFDAISGRKIYQDAAGTSTVFNTAVANDVLTWSYTRYASGRCSLLTGGQPCWAQIAREAMLPAQIAGQPAPLAACEVAYRRAASVFTTARNDPSVVSYPVTITLTRSGQATVMSRGRLDCEPAE